MDLLRLRLLLPEQLPEIEALLIEHQAVFLEDDDQLDLPGLSSAISQGRLIGVFSGEVIVGVLGLSEFSESQRHAMLHFLIHPRYLRQALREALFWQLIHVVFINYDLQKIKVKLMTIQSTGVKILKQLGFRQVGIFFQDTQKNGQPVDVIWFELFRQAWQF